MTLPLVGVVMGSENDWPIMKSAAIVLASYSIRYEAKVISAHRTPDLLYAYAKGAKGRLALIIAGAGGAAHLPGMLAALTTVPVLGVPISSPPLDGLDALLSMVQMPAGTPVAVLGMDVTGAINAACLAAHLLAPYHPEVVDLIDKSRREKTKTVLDTTLSVKKKPK